jgi:hypothetical protein
LIPSIAFLIDLDRIEGRRRPTAEIRVKVATQRVPSGGSQPVARAMVEELSKGMVAVGSLKSLTISEYFSDEGDRLFESTLVQSGSWS